MHIVQRHYILKYKISQKLWGVGWFFSLHMIAFNITLQWIIPISICTNAMILFWVTIDRMWIDLIICSRPIRSSLITCYSASQNKVPPKCLIFSGKSGIVIPKYYRLFKSMVYWPPEEFWIFQFGSGNQRQFY